MGRKKRDKEPGDEVVRAIRVDLNRELSEVMEIMLARRGGPSGASFLRSLLIDEARAAGLLRDGAEVRDGTR